MPHLLRTLATIPVLLLFSNLVLAEEVSWTDIRTLGVEGRGFEKTKSFFDRLPAAANTWPVDGSTTSAPTGTSSRRAASAACASASSM